MAITIRNRKQGKATLATAVAPKSDDTTGTKRNNGHCKPLPVPASLSDLTRIRVGHLQSLMGCSHSQIYVKLQRKELPKPSGYDGKRPFWTAASIRAFLSE